jgi:hypothetical protein
MYSLADSLLLAIPIGLGGTLTFDLWAQFLKRVFHIVPSNICLVGRWLRYMPEGTFRHASILSAPPKVAECLVGWIAHYTIGVTLACAFIALAGDEWLRHPKLIPALGFGIITVAAPLFIMQPSFGLGFAASKTAHPGQARVRSVMNHAAFGAGLYVFALLVNWVLQI